MSGTEAEMDVEVDLEDRPGALADLAEALGEHDIALLGGGGFAHLDGAIAHFLVADGHRAAAVLEQAGLRVRSVSEVVTLRLRQGVPGQLGALTRRLASAGVDLRAQYSDHDHRLVLVVRDGEQAAREVVRRWDAGA